VNSKFSRYYTFVRPILKNQKVQNYSTIAFSMIAVLIFSLFAIRPTISTILSLQKSIVEEKSIVDKLQTKAVNLTKAQEELAKIPASTVSKVDNLLPDRTEVTALSDDLTNLAAANDASISALQYQPLELVGQAAQLNPNPTLKEIDFTMNMSGSYPKIINLLNSLANSSRLIKIDTINLTQTETQVLIVSIIGKAYYLQN
jgi:Tfp pilus assembly protein PilO